MERFLVTGAGGQIGTELVRHLGDRHGTDAILATDVRDPSVWARGGPGAQVEQLDCLDADALLRTARDFRTTCILHLASILSATAEASPYRAYRVNMDSVVNVLEVAARTGCRVFTPSSIAVFGPESPRELAPQTAVLRPTTMYGVTKVAGEMLSDYYHARFGVDVRGLRFPGLVSYTAPPGGGTTDYAVEIFHAAVERRRYICPLHPDTRMAMMYMPDAIRAIVELMDADSSSLRHRNAYNLSAMHFTPAELADAIRVRRPELEIAFEPDPVRQAIADSWPTRIDDARAREEWGWRHEYELPEMVDAMLRGLEAEQTGRAATLAIEAVG